jgi:acyl-coenzyme A synthetase/AMP-(fatty) acid ligase
VRHRLPSVGHPVALLPARVRSQRQDAERLRLRHPRRRIARLEFAELPKTISGKIRRVDLRRREERAAVGEAVTEYRDEHFPELKG